jgi:hypothetical protein
VFRTFRKSEVQIFAPCKNGAVDLQPVKRKSENFFQKTSKNAFFPKFYLDSKLKVPKNPENASRNFGKKSVHRCARDFGVIFDTFSMLRQIATALFSIKTPKFQVFSGHFCILRFGIFSLLQICDISEKKCPKMSRFSQNSEGPAAQRIL